MKTTLKKGFAFLTAFVLLCGGSGCGGGASAETGSGDRSVAGKTELVVFAAASMTETLTEIADVYEKSHENIEITFNFDSSGTLKTQIEEGAECDLFISAGQKQMDQLDSSLGSDANPDGLDFVLQGSRADLLENEVVLCVPDPEAEEAVKSFDDMAEKLRGGRILLSMGNSDVPVGQYAQKLLSYYELSEDNLARAGHITYGTNVKEVTAQISEASVDCGIIYCTDAFSAGLDIVDSATAELCGQVVYPAAVLNVSGHPEEAQEFLDYLKRGEAMDVFESVGFTAAGV